MDKLTIFLDTIWQKSPTIGVIIAILFTIEFIIIAIGYLIFGKNFLLYGFKQGNNDSKLNIIVSSVNGINERITNIEKAFNELTGILTDVKYKEGNEKKNLLTHGQKAQLDNYFKRSEKLSS
jgi:hypothetical protein